MKTAVALFLLTIGTLFPASETTPLQRIAFGSCLKEDKPQLIWSAVVAARQSEVDAATKELDALQGLSG